MIARLCGLAVDARAATRTADPAALACAARWIAANALGIRGKTVVAHHAGTPRLIEVEIADLDGLLEQLAAQPALVEPESLPASWRFYLRALGIPLLDRPIPDALAGGASVLAVALP